MDLDDILNAALERWPEASLRVEPTGEVSVITGIKVDEEGRVITPDEE